jgi:glycosyltransferase involved in cell wall biosynthesis
VLALRHALAFALERPELRASIALRGRDRIEARHSLARMTDRYLALYRGIDVTRAPGAPRREAAEAVRT